MNNSHCKNFQKYNWSWSFEGWRNRKDLIRKMMYCYMKSLLIDYFSKVN